MCIVRMARDIGEGVWVSRGLPKALVSTADQLAVCRDILTSQYIPQVASLHTCRLYYLGPSFESRTRDPA